MPDLGSRHAPSPSVIASPAPANIGRVTADQRSLLRRNNLLSLLSSSAWFIATPFIPLHLASLGASVALVGVIGGSQIMPLLLSIPAGGLVDTRGPKLVAKGSVILFAVAGAILTGLHTIWAVALAYILMGIANIGFAVAPQTVVASASDRTARVQNYGYNFLWNSIGAMVGPSPGE